MTVKPRSSDLSFIGISTSITQSESKRLYHVMAVLEYIQQNHLFSAKQLEKSIKVSRDSIDRTLRSLEQKKIIELKEKRARGEKFYKIKSKPKLESYLDILMRWWYAKIMMKNVPKGVTKLKKSISRGIKKAKYSSRTLSDEDQKKLLWFVSPNRQKRITPKVPYPNPVTIWNLPFTQALKIVNIYAAGLLCEICFKENKISFLIEHTDEQVCERGHVEALQSIEPLSQSTGSSNHSHFLRRRSKSISDSDLRIQKRIYLGRTRKPKKDNNGSGIIN